jgi:hypothetical protein
MLKRIFVFVLIGALFFVALQFISVFFYTWEFEDFIRDEVKFAPVRESDDKEHLVEHIKEQAQYYSLQIDEKNIRVEKSTNDDSGVTSLSIDVVYTTPVDLYYFTFPMRRHVFTATMY